MKRLLALAARRLTYVVNILTGLTTGVVTMNGMMSNVIVSFTTLATIGHYPEN